jgi:succinoglycan biosynthesis transport protein ExoP
VNANPPNDKAGRKNSIGGVGPQHSSDPIARNPKDTGKSEEAIITTKVTRSNGLPVLPANTPLPDQPWGLEQQVQPAPSAVDLLTSILRFKWTLLAVFVLVAAPMIAAIWTQMVPQYRARAEVQVRPIIPYLVFRTEDSGAIPFYESFVNTQVSIMRSLTVLQRVLDQREVQETQWYKNPRQSLKQRLHGNQVVSPMERLRDTLSARPRGRTEIIDVSFMDPSAKDAKVIVDAVLEQYMAYIGEKSDATKDELYRKLADQYKSLENEIGGREKVCAELAKSLGTEAPQELISQKRVRLDETQARLSELQQRIAVLEWGMKQATTGDSNDVVAATGTMAKQPKYHEDAEWRKLDIDVRTIRHQIANSLLTPNHPDKVRMVKNLEFAEELLRLREAQLDERWRDRQKNAAEASTTATEWLNQPINVLGPSITTTNTTGLAFVEGLIPSEDQLAQAKYEEQLLLAEFKKQQTEFQSLFDNAQLFEKENTALRHKRELFDAVRQRLDQKNMERNVPGSIEVLMSAFVPSRPDSDRRIVFTAMALVLGLGIGGGVAFLRASRNQTIYAPKDMPHPMQVPILGLVPVTHTRRLLPDRILEDQSRLTESIRVVRTTLLSRLDSHGSTTVLVTSAAEGTGKSRFTMMLGKSLAQAGKRVLVVDADFRKMALTQRVELSDKSGFIECLCCRSIDRQHIFSTETPGLSIMPAGKRGNDRVVFEEIANGAFKTCIDQLREQYDIILLDSSPILPVADATILSNQVDGTIMVERELVSRRSNVINALARLNAAGGRLLGTVFVGSGGREDYGYGYYYYGRTSES